MVDGQAPDLEQPAPPVGAVVTMRPRPAPTPAATSDSAVASVPRKTSRTAGLASTVAGSPSPTIRPPGEADEAVHDRHERADHVLDPDHRRAARPGPPATISTSCGDLRVGQAAGDLVEQQQARPRREGAGQLQALALRAGRAAGGPVGVADRPVSTSARAAASWLAWPALPPPCCAATSTFSKTVMPSNGRGTWYVRPMPSRQRSARRAG